MKSIKELDYILEEQLTNDIIKECTGESGFDISKLDEGILGKLVGGAAGALVGPALGKAIARALGIEKGILYDLLTSRLVTTAIGSSLGGGKNK